MTEHLYRFYPLNIAVLTVPDSRSLADDTRGHLRRPR
jgi:hypothetical protein